VSIPYFGATTVGIRVSEGVVLASEKRMSYGGFIISRAGKKVFKITDRIGVAFAGLFADMQALARILGTEVKFYELTVGKKMNVRSAAKLLSNILYSQKILPFFSEVLVGGYDSEGSHLFVLDPLGSVIEDDYAAVGSGASIAIGVIESAYKKDLSLADAEKIVISSIEAAMKRDTGSGDGIDIIVISKDKILEKEVEVKK